jgi:hypothetical protein
LAAALPYPKCEPKGAMPMRGLPNFGPRAFTLGSEEGSHARPENNAGIVKGLFVGALLVKAQRSPSIAADVVGYLVKVTGKETCKAAKDMARQEMHSSIPFFDVNYKYKTYFKEMNRNENS